MTHLQILKMNNSYLVVELDEACRRQQMGEGWFEILEDVPTQAISMSIRQIMKIENIVCSVPDLRKAEAVELALEGPVTPDLPASILQQHQKVKVFLDQQSIWVISLAVGEMIDLQINGFAGVDFNSDELKGEDLLRAAMALKNIGVHKFLPTLITAPLDKMRSRAAKLALMVEENEELNQMIPGIHLEGPFISSADGYRGAHPLADVQLADLETVKELQESCAGKLLLLTLAPSRINEVEVTKFLTDQGVVVSAGHTNASTDQLKNAIDSGLQMFTHLGNACPRQLPRHDNIIQRVLALSDKLWISYIADGLHLPFFVLKNLLNTATGIHALSLFRTQFQQLNARQVTTLWAINRLKSRMMEFLNQRMVLI